MKWAWLVTGVVALGLVGFIIWATLQRTGFEDACYDLDGVPIKSHVGPIVCIDRDALIEVPDV